MSDPLFNQLTQPSKYADPTPPTGFDTTIAFLLGLCCNRTYEQYAKYPTPLPTSGTLHADYTYEIIGDPIKTSESIGLGSVAGQTGDYRTVPIGFGMKVSSSSGSFNVIALRGTQTYDEWIKDAEAFPAQFLVGDNGGKGYAEGILYGYYAPGSVHGGFYNVYVQGSAGALPEPSKMSGGKYEFSRPDGSIAAAVQSIVSHSAFDKSLPLYITGHSLGAALAVLCAMDVGTNFANAFKKDHLSMYNLAGPLVAAGLTVYTHDIYGPPHKFVDSYNDVVSHSFRIVNAADLVPILPPAETTISEASVSFAHVTPNNVTFCDQTGSIGENHSCSNTYVKYLEQLANGFPSP